MNTCQYEPCGKPFEPRPGREGKFCSKVCSNKSHGIRRDYPEPPPVDGARWIQLGHAKFALVDASDFDRVNEFWWTFSRKLGYAMSHVGQRGMTYLHRFIMDAPEHTEVDHRNPLDKLDCRRENLRVTNRSGNSVNRVGVKAKSGYRGVYQPHGEYMWIASITQDGKTTDLGRFEDPADAARAYDCAARQLRSLHGKPVRLNFPDSGEPAAHAGDEYRAAPTPRPVDRSRGAYAPRKIINWDPEKGTQVCTGCFKELPLAAFTSDRHKKSGRHPSCRECVSTQRSARQKARTEGIALPRRARSERRLAELQATTKTGSS